MTNIIARPAFRKIVEYVCDPDTEYKRLPFETRQAWTKALRSGDFKQADSYLKQVDWYNEATGGRLDEPTVIGYCCLGVLCEVDEDIQTEGTDLDVFQLYEFGASIGDPVCTMPNKDMYLHWKLDDQVANSLAALNDQGASFEDIADVIENFV